MFVWQTRTYAPKQGIITLSDDDILVILEGESKSISRQAYMKGMLFEYVVRTFSFRIAVEICGLIHTKPNLTFDTKSSALTTKPSFGRIFGGGRGADWVVWLFGKNIRTRVRTPTNLKIPDMSFKEFLNKGFPQKYEEVIGKPEIQKIPSVVEKPSHLSCMCSTGAVTPWQHGNIDVFLTKDHPFAPIEHSIKLGRCSICGQSWSFEAAGDPHYSYNYQVRPFPDEYLR